jgi:hypothetical protein
MDDHLRRPVIAVVRRQYTIRSHMFSELRIELFDGYVPNPNTRSKSGKTTFKTFWKVREQILAVLQLHGSTGPEDGHTPEPTYWLVEDQLNNELYQAMSVHDPSGIDEDWLTDLVKVLHKNRGWGLAVGNLRNDAMLLVFADKLMVRGRIFSKCRTASDVIEAARKAVRRSASRKRRTSG